MKNRLCYTLRTIRNFLNNFVFKKKSLLSFNFKRFIWPNIFRPFYFLGYLSSLCHVVPCTSRFCLFLNKRKCNKTIFIFLYFRCKKAKTLFSIYYFLIFICLFFFLSELLTINELNDIKTEHSYITSRQITSR